MWEQGGGGGGAEAAAAETLALFLLPGRSRLTLTGDISGDSPTRLESNGELCRRDRIIGAEDLGGEVIWGGVLGGGVIRTGDSPKSDCRGEY